MGIETISTSQLFLLQHKYVRDLLDHDKLIGMKESTTPMSSSGSLVLCDGTSPEETKQYRSLIGVLQYLLLTRPDIAYSVNKLAQSMHAPTQTHRIAAKCLLRYLKYTL